MWDLQRDMHSWIAPSIYKVHMGGKEDPVDQDFTWICHRYADQRWNEDDGHDAYDALCVEALEMCVDTQGNPHFAGIKALCNAIAEKAIEYDATTNGGFEVYLDSHTSIPWCDEEDLHAWY